MNLINIHNQIFVVVTQKHAKAGQVVFNGQFYQDFFEIVAPKSKFTL